MCLSIFSLIISVISLALSIHNWYIGRMHLKIKLNHFTVTKENDLNVLIVHCTISNCSKNNLTINSIDLINNKIKYNSIENSLSLGSIFVELFEQKAEWETTSIDLPLKLEPFDSVSTSLIFPLGSNTILCKKSKIIFYTSRGKKKLTIINNRHN